MIVEQHLSNQPDCSEEEKETIANLQKKPVEDLKALVLAETKEREQAHTDFKSEVEKLQATFEKLSKDRDSTLEDIKGRYNIGFVKQLIKSESKPKTDL